MTTQPMMGAGSDISRVLRLHVGWRIMGSDLGLAQEIITVPTSPVQWGLRHSGRGLFQSGNEELMPRRGSSNYRQQSAPFFFFFLGVINLPKTKSWLEEFPSFMRQLSAQISSSSLLFDIGGVCVSSCVFEIVGDGSQNLQWFMCSHVNKTVMELF